MWQVIFTEENENIFSLDMSFLTLDISFYVILEA